MNNHVIYVLGLVLTAPLCGQGVLYSPTDLDTKTEGALYAYYHARYPDGRLQYGDGENRGRVAAINAIQTRLDARNHTTATTQGRKWTNLVVAIGEGDVSKFTATFATNFMTTPTTVFDAAWSLPAVTGSPSTTPAPYGGTNGEYTLPFKNTWLYTGKGDIIHDWQHTGGTLDNNVTWASSSTRPYYFDSYSNAGPSSSIDSTYAYLPSTRLNNTSAGVTGRCNDSEHGSTSTGAYIVLVATLYGPQYPVDNYRNRLLFYHYSYYTGYENPVIHGISLHDNTAGVELATGCNKLHLGAPFALVPRVTTPSAYSTSGYSGYRVRLIKWIAAMASQTVTVQAAWADSSTSAFNLSQAHQAVLPPGVPARAPSRIHTYHYLGATSSTGFGPYGGSSYYYLNPAFAYTTK